ncbi:MAG: hypothetical protein U0263_20790 [Polyangiaceae bacterium]
MRSRLFRTSAVTLLLTLGACGSDDGGSGAKSTGGAGGAGGGTGGGTSGSGGTQATGGAGGTMAGGSGGAGGSSTGGASGTGASSGTGATSGTGGGSSTGCMAGDFLASLGKTKVMVGAAMEDSIAKSAPFDLRYQYLSGGIADGAGPCAKCDTGCAAGGKSCANSGPGCAWWGCWQYDKDPPGAFVRDFVKKAKADQQVPMLTYYMLLQASGVSEGQAEVTKANDAAFMARYYADFRFVAQQIGSEVAFLHIEPDFWGYAQQVNDDPTKIPAAVASANSQDCGSLPNTMAGMGTCMITMAKKYAPNVKVSLHGSGWATKFDVLLNKDSSFDVAGHAGKLGAFLAAAGPNADFITVDAADRDAAWYESQGQNRWWDDTNAKLPNFHQAFAWSKALGDAAKKPIFWWQLPVGNMAQSNSNDHWKDNRVDYFLGHMGEVAAAHGIGAAFGAGAGGQTTPSTDGGNLVSKVKAYSAGGGQAPCP